MSDYNNIFRHTFQNFPVLSYRSQMRNLQICNNVHSLQKAHQISELHKYIAKPMQLALHLEKQTFFYGI